MAPPYRIHTAYIDCPDDELLARLATRGESDGSMREELAEAAELRRLGYFRLDGAKQPDSLAGDAAAWVLAADEKRRSRLADK